MLSGEKHAYKQNEVEQNRTIRRYRELRSSNILKAIGVSEQLARTLPDKNGKRYRIDQDYVLTVVRKMYPDWFDAVAEQAYLVRNQPKEEANKVATIEIQQELYDKLFEKPFTSRKLDILSHLTTVELVGKAGRAAKYIREAVQDGQAAKPRKQKVFNVMKLADYQTAVTNMELDVHALV